ncbi:hypothetical protein [Streptomyces sp. NBC_00893]|uniref:phage tail protein n=1 Tax=Streptomyces sp. NBC_00893 TaxID=2975862 RepID=UPI00225A452E|nr:hypothetical protein [Streptomyces sp. NBC_00893]MCX4846576.1 hypothetical protein [Streptomyces sp. NBC_00893]
MKAVPEKDATAARPSPADPDVSRTTVPAPERPPGDRPAPALAPRSLQRLQRAAGNRAVSRLVAQRYTAPVKPSPAQAPGFRKVKSDVAAKKVRLAAHAPAATESKSAQDAAVAPPDDKEAQGKAANAEKMNAAKPGEFNKQAFIDAVNKAIDSQAPKNLDQADKFSKSGKADKIKDEVDGKVKDGKDSSSKDIDTATKAPPDTSAAKDKPVTPMSPDQPPANPGAPSAADAVPDQQPAAVTDFSQGPAANDQAMADAEVTEDQLAKGNEPEFDQALSTKKTAEADSAKAPAKGRAAESQQLNTAKAGAAASGAQAMNALTATRSSAGKQVDGGKDETKSKDEKKRAEVAAKLQKVYDGTKKDVETTLSDLDKKVDTAFTQGEKAARDAFTADHKRRMKKYKDKRYSGMLGPAKWAKDKLMGMPKEANDLFQEARKLYVAKMQTVISSVADIIGTELGRAKARIAKGRTELKAEVDKLPADLREFGQEAATDFAGKFDDLEATVNEKSEQLVQDLAQKYTAALNKVDEEIKKLQEANKGLVDKAKDAIVGVIKTINELKNLLLGILAKAASAIMKIIKDPIGFLGNLVKAVGAGLNLFITNIAEHLKTGVVSWLLGTAVKAGLELPQKFDLKGIIQLIGSLLGLTWANIRTRITRKGIPDQALTAVETSVPVAKKLAAEGPAGAVKEIEAEAGDIKATILEKLTSYLIPTVIIAGITWIISLLNPASAFVRAVKGIIDIVTFIVNQGAQIVEFVNAVLDAVIAIANGGSAGVPKMVETALSVSVPLLIGFLASLLGIGSLANKVKSVFHAVTKPVNRAIDKIVNFITKAGKKIWAKLKGKEKNTKNPGADKAERAKKQQELPDAKREAKDIVSKHEKNDSPVDAVTKELLTLRGKFSWIKGFSAKKKGSGFSLSMKASNHPLGPYTEIDDIKSQLDKFSPDFIRKVHTHWWEHQIKKPKIESGQLWERGVLDQTEAKAKEYLTQDSTAHDVKKNFYDGNNRDINAAAFETHVFGVKSAIRKKVVKLLGDAALKELKKNGRSAAREVPETRQIISSMKFLANRDTYGVYEPFPPSPDEREHTNFYPVAVDLDEQNSTPDKRVTTVRTRAGKTFTVTEDLRTGLKLQVAGMDLRLKEPGDPRGVTQDSPGFLPNQNLNRSHVIADWFGGSGYREALNLVTASDHYNKTVMGDAESDIATEILAFAEKHNLARGQVSMDLTVTVTFGELLRDVFMRNIQSQEWYTAGDAESEAQLKKLTNALLNPPVRRVMGVLYAFTLKSTVSDVPHAKGSRPIQSDDHLFIKRSAGQ